MLDQGLDLSLGIELIFLGENSFECFYTLLKRKGNQLDVEIQGSAVGNLVQVMDKIPRGYPTALNINGKGILFKTVTFHEQSLSTDMLLSAYPGIQPGEFYAQQFAPGQNALLHIARKSMVDPILDTFKSAGINVYSVGFGASVSAAIWSLLDKNDSPLKFNGHIFLFDEQQSFYGYQYVQNEKSPFPPKISGLLMAEDQLISYAAAFQLLLHEKIEMISAKVESVDDAFENFLQNVILKKTGMIYLGILFTSLLISFLFFSYYNDSNAGLATRAGAFSASENQLEVYNKNIQEKEKLLQSLKWYGGYNSAFILNELSASCPRQLTLLTISMNPQSKTENAEVPKISLSGLSNNLRAVNNWIFVLKEKKWIKSVRLLGYNEDAESENYRFNLNITY